MNRIGFSGLLNFESVCKDICCFRRRVWLDWGFARGETFSPVYVNVAKRGHEIRFYFWKFCVSTLVVIHCHTRRRDVLKILPNSHFCAELVLTSSGVLPLGSGWGEKTRDSCAFIWAVRCADPSCMVRQMVQVRQDRPTLIHAVDQTEQKHVLLWWSVAVRRTHFDARIRPRGRRGATSRDRALVPPLSTECTYFYMSSVCQH